MSKSATTTWNHAADLPRRAQAAPARRPSLVRRLFDRLLTWQERAAMRNDLRSLPDWMLRDLGITRGTAVAEGRRPHWAE